MQYISPLTVSTQGGQAPLSHHSCFLQQQVLIIFLLHVSSLEFNVVSAHMSLEGERKIHIPCVLLFQSRSNCLHWRSSSDNIHADPSKNKLFFFAFKALSGKFSGMGWSRSPTMGMVNHNTDGKHYNSPSKEKSKLQGYLRPDLKKFPRELQERSRLQSKNVETQELGKQTVMPVTYA